MSRPHAHSLAPSLAPCTSPPPPSLPAHHSLAPSLTHSQPTRYLRPPTSHHASMSGRTGGQWE
eukprot:1633233-Rhodomonas_salina.1